MKTQKALPPSLAKRSFRISGINRTFGLAATCLALGIAASASATSTGRQSVQISPELRLVIESDFAQPIPFTGSVAYFRTYRMEDPSTSSVILANQIQFTQSVERLSHASGCSRPKFSTSVNGEMSAYCKERLSNSVVEILFSMDTLIASSDGRSPTTPRLKVTKTLTFTGSPYL